MKHNHKLIFKNLILVVILCLCLGYLQACNKDKEPDLSSGSFACGLEEDLVNNKYRVSWSLSGADKTTMYDVSLEELNSTSEAVKNRPSLTYMDFSPSDSKDYKMTIKLKNSDSILKVLNFHFKSALSNENIQAVYDGTNVKLSYKKQLEDSTAYILVNNKLYKETNDSITFSSQDINYKSFSFSERLFKEDGTNYDYTIVSYSASLVIQIPSEPVITFRPVSGNTYALKCDKFNTFKDFDIDLVQDGKSLVSTKNTIKKDLVDGKVKVNAADISEKNITLQMIAHGERTQQTLVVDTVINKEFTYVNPSTIDIVDGLLKVTNVSSDTRSYFVTRKTYDSNDEETLEVEANNAYSIPANYYYKISVLPVLTGSYFTKSTETSWFEYFESPTINVVDAETLMYQVKGPKDYYSRIVVSINHDGKKELLNLNFQDGSAVFSLYNLGKDYIFAAGYYYLEAYVEQIAGYKPTFNDGTEFTVYKSSVTSASIYKTPTPDLTVNKIQNGKALSFEAYGYDDYYITVDGLIEDTFKYANGKSSYVLVNSVFTDSFSRNITIISKKKLINDSNTIVINSDPYQINGFKVLDRPLESISLQRHDSNIYIEFNNQAIDTYYFELYYKVSSTEENLVSTKIVEASYSIAFNELIANALAGEYRLAVYRSSNNNYELNSNGTNYTLVKLATPTLNVSKSTSYLIYWATSDTITGYNVKYDGVTQSTKNNNYSVDPSKIKEGASSIEVVSYGSGLVIDSDPLEIKLFRLHDIAVSIENSILGYQAQESGITLSATTNLLYKGETLNENAIVGNHIDLIELTSNHTVFDKPTPETYTLDITFAGNSNDYDFIYGFTKSISFIKQPYPSINPNTQMYTENNNQKFVMAIDDGDYIYNNDYAPVLSGKHTVYFIIKGDGTNTIDSNVFVYNTGA